MLDTLGSFIIGGIVLMLMTIVVVNLQDTARDTMFNEISQISLAEMSQTMERELTNLGYRVSGPQKILSMTSQTIRFLSDYDNNGIIDTVAYAMQRTKAGPVVTRTISSPGRAPLAWTTRGSMVLFTGYDQNGAATFDAARIRAVEASMLTSNILYDKLNGSSATAEGTSGSGTTTVVNHTQLLNTAVDCKAGAYWHKTMYPRNLTVEAPQFAEEIAPPPNNGATDPGTTDPGVTDPGTTDPGTTDPGTTDPGTTDPGGTVTPPAEEDPDPVIVPPGNKNDPCPCGSGLKYRNCHGK